MFISDIMNVIVKEAILDIWNNIDIRNTFSDQKLLFLLVPIELVPRIDISTSDGLIIDIRNSHFY